MAPSSCLCVKLLLIWVHQWLSCRYVWLVGAGVDTAHVCRSPRWFCAGFAADAEYHTVRMAHVVGTLRCTCSVWSMGGATLHQAIWAMFEGLGRTRVGHGSPGALSLAAGWLCLCIQGSVQTTRRQLHTCRHHIAT